MTTADVGSITEEQVYCALKKVIDPEIGLNIVDLGLIYNLDISDGGNIGILMTLTTPACPLHARFAEAVESALWQSIPQLTGVTVDLVWKPRWNPAMISPEGQAMLGWG